MCEANVYLIDKDGNEILYLESVDKIVPGQDGIVMENIYSQRRTIKAEIKEMALVDHRIVIVEK